MSNYSATASASHRLPPIFRTFLAKHTPKPILSMGQSVTGTATTSAVSFNVAPLPAANEALEWNADTWLAAFSSALDGEDSEQQDALAYLAKQAVEDAQQRGDTERVNSIRATAAEAKYAREKAHARQSIVPNIEVPFGTGTTSLPLTPADTAQKAPSAENSKAPAARSNSSIDRESREILKYISEDFVMLSGKTPCAYHIVDGDELGKESLRQYCAKHYGDVLTITQDKDGNRLEVRKPAGDIWWEWNDPERRVVRRIVMEPTSKPEADDNPEVFNRWHQLKKTMCDCNLSAGYDDIKILVDHLLYLSGGDTVGVTYFLCWLAQLYQTPEIKIPTAILLYSKNNRVGKNLLGRLISKVFGPPLVNTGGTGKLLTANFDDGVMHKRIVFLNEVRLSGKDRDAYEEFKNKISEDTVSFEGKGDKTREVRNVAHYIITTNRNDALPLMDNDGRIAVLRCLAERQSDDYYKKFVTWVDGPGAPLVAGALANWEFPKDWDPHAPVPQTEAARAMQHAAKGDLYGLVYELVEDRRPPFKVCFGSIAWLCSQMKTLHADSLGRTEVNNKTLGAALNALCGEPVQCWVKHNGKSDRQRLYFWRDAEQWKSATPDQRAHHLEYPDAPRMFPVQQPKTEVSDHE